MSRPLATYQGHELIRERDDGSREILDHRRLAEVFEQIRVAEKYLAALREEIRAAVEECGSDTLEVVEESAGRDFLDRAPLYDELPEAVRELVGPEDYDRLFSVSVSELQQLYETIYKESGAGTKKDAAALFRTLTDSMCERKTRKRLRRKKD